MRFKVVGTGVVHPEKMLIILGSRSCPVGEKKVITLSVSPAKNYALKEIIVHAIYLARGKELFEVLIRG